MLVDAFGRHINYLRLAVTDRCNLRCQYCMPAEGIDIVPRKELLTFKEMYRVTRVLSELGVDKVRLTGGEPFVRKDLIGFIESLSFNEKLKEINITSNGALIEAHLDRLVASKVNSINLSLDTLQKDRFHQITRRDSFDKVWRAYQALLESPLKVKLNVVVQPGFNTDELVDFVRLTAEQKVSVRFIEEMPFNGIGQRKSDEKWDYKRVLDEISKAFPKIETLENEKSSTSYNYRVKGFAGSFGVIPAFSRSICTDCNRIRITSTGLFKNCLFDDGVFDLKTLLRQDASDEEIKAVFLATIAKKPKDGFQAEANRKSGSVSESMSTIGG